MTGTSHATLLLAGLTIVAFIALWAYPAPEAAPLGVPIAGWTVCDLRPGETVERPFHIEHPFTRVSLSYDIDEARQVRSWFIGPDGRETEAVAYKGPQGEDAWRLEVHDPVAGEWAWRLAAVADADGQGHLTKGDFIVLGFGLDEEVRRTEATGGTMPSGRCP